MTHTDVNSCPICGKSIDYNLAECDRCGFSAGSKTIEDEAKLRTYIHRLKKSWNEEIKTKQRLVETLPSLSAVARLIGEAKSQTSSHVKLARAIEKHPELLECRNIDAARRRLKQIEQGAAFTAHKLNYDFESDLQRYLCERWNDTQFSAEWILETHGTATDCKYRTDEIGEIDLLARGKGAHNWLVVELKRDQSSDETVGQLLRYMGWVKSRLAVEDETVQGLVISATVDAPLTYALSCVQNVKVLVYKRKKDTVLFCSPEAAAITSEFTKLSIQEQQALLDALRKMDQPDDPPK